MTTISLPGFVNLRDAGGYAADGGIVARGKLFRSDAPTAWSDADSRFFSDLPLARVIDLRSAEERGQDTDRFAAAGFSVSTIEIIQGALSSFGSLAAGTPTVADLYRLLLDQSGPALVAAVTAVAEGVTHGAVDVHCTAGKDRTGVVIALVHSVLGVSEDNIVDDYAQTEANLRGPWLDAMLARYSTLLGDADPSVLALISASPREGMASTLDYLNTQHGGANAYLDAHGFSAAARSQLRDALIVPASSTTAA